MEPDKQFVRRLKEVDEKLQVGWNYIQQRWQVVRDDRRMKLVGYDNGKPILHSCDKPYHVFTVQGETGEYRPLDQRVIDRLHEIDMYRFARIKDYVREIEAQEDDYKAKRQKQQSEYVEELTKENFRQISDAIEADSYGAFHK